MTTARKTIDVADILERTNHILGLPRINQDEKRALSLMLETILHATGNYQGYSNTFDVNGASKEEITARDYDRQYLVSKHLYDDYKRYGSLRDKDGFR